MVNFINFPFHEILTKTIQYQAILSDKLTIFPLKINWSHLSEVGECGIAVRWAHSRITP